MNRRKFFESSLGAGAGTVLFGRPLTAGTDRKVKLPLRLNANENAIGLSPSAREAVLEGLSDANRYPFLNARDLLRTVSERFSLPEECVLLGNGSSEVLRLIVRALAADQPSAISANPTYEAIAQQMNAYSLPIETVPLRNDRAHDLERMREVAARITGTVLVYICNPNNPTGTLTPTSEILAWIDEAPGNQIFIVDEAYHHYVESDVYSSLLREAARRNNLLVTRTFSKIYAMAGLRIGFGVASAEIIRRMRPFTRMNLNSLGITAALASLGDESFLEESFKSNKRSKKILYETLEELEIERLDSQTNFVMHRIKGSLDNYNSRMRSEKINVGRPFPPMDDFSRISLGLPEEMEYFCERLRAFRDKGWI
jgi:histidinol-phosphate aminotransferase